MRRALLKLIQNGVFTHPYNHAFAAGMGGYLTEIIDLQSNQVKRSRR